MSLPKIIQKILTNYGYGSNLTGNDNDVVHKTGDEEVYGKKTFKEDTTDNRAYINMKCDSFKREDIPENDTHYYSLNMLARDDSDSGGNIVGAVQLAVRPSGARDAQLFVYDRVNGRTPYWEKSGLVTGYDENEIPYCMAASTSELRASDRDILTRDWIPKDTRIVHTTGAETIDGAKTFLNSSVWATRAPAITLKNVLLDGIVNPPSDASRTWHFNFTDKNDTVFGRIRYEFLTTGSRNVFLGVVNGSGEYSQITVGYDPQGRAFATAPSTDGSRTVGQDIVTRDWLAVDSRLVHTTGAETISGTKTFTNASIYATNAPAMGFKHNQLDGIVNPPDATKSWQISFSDKNDTLFGRLRYEFLTTGSRNVFLSAVNGSGAYSQIAVGYDAQGRAFATAPSTDGSRTVGQDILTRDWIPNDTRIVHTTGNEAISGTKNFSALVASDWFSFEKDTPYFFIINSSMSKDSLPSGNLYSGINFAVKSQHVLTRQQIWLNTDGSSGWANSCKAFDNLSGSTYSATFALYVNKAGTSKVAAVSNVTVFRPDQGNGTITLGTSNNRWGTLYTTTNPNVSSDERLKNTIHNFSDDVLDAWGEINWVGFKYNISTEEKGDSARIHSGMIAQQAKSAFLKHNVDIERYGFYCWDSWESEPEIKDNEGNIIREAREAGEEFSIRYGEALCMEAAYNRRRVSRVEERLLALEQELAELKNSVA